MPATIHSAANTEHPGAPVNDFVIKDGITYHPSNQTEVDFLNISVPCSPTRVTIRDFLEYRRDAAKQQLGWRVLYALKTHTLLGSPVLEFSEITAPEPGMPPTTRVPDPATFSYVDDQSTFRFLGTTSEIGEEDPVSFFSSHTRMACAQHRIDLYRALNPATPATKQDESGQITIKPQSAMPDDLPATDSNAPTAPSVNAPAQAQPIPDAGSPPPNDRGREIGEVTRQGSFSF